MSYRFREQAGSHISIREKLHPETPHHPLQGTGQLRQLMARCIGLIGPGGRTHRQISNIHKIAIDPTCHLSLFFGRAGDHQVSLMNLMHRGRDSVQHPRFCCMVAKALSKRLTSSLPWVSIGRVRSPCATCSAALTASLRGRTMLRVSNITRATVANAASAMNRLTMVRDVS